LQQLKIAILLAASIILQASLRKVWEPLGYIDLPLIVVVYFALQRNAVRAVIIGCIAGLGMDSMSAGLLGAGGFSRTLTAYIIASLAARVNLDNPLIRIPVLAGAAMLCTGVYYLLHKLLNQVPPKPFVITAAHLTVWTTVVGTIIMFTFDMFFSERAHQRRQMAFRRRMARRTPTRR
jgi:rod shape-determining protein MreD